MPNRLTIFILWGLLSLGLCFANGLPLSDPDLWWHLASGRWMLAHSAVPRTDHWNAFALGKPWIAYSWAFELLTAFSESHWGVYGLAILQCLLALLLLMSLGHCLFSLARQPITGAVLGLIAFFSTAPYFALRPQVLSWICFLFAIYFAEQLSQKERKNFSLLLFFLVMLCWANIHLTFIFGLIVGSFWSLRVPLTLHNNRHTLLLFALGFLATLFTPYFGAHWFTLFAKAGHPFSHIYIAEFQPATLKTPAALAILLLALFLIYAQKNFCKALSPVQLCMLLVLSFVGLVVQKFAPYAVISLALGLAKIQGQIPRQSLFLPWDFRTTVFANLLLGALLAVFSLYSAQYSLNSLKLRPVDEELLPTKALDFIEANALPFPLLNTFNDGGYVIYRFLQPDGSTLHPVPLDGRTNVNAPHLTRAFLAALYGKPNWRDYLNLTQAKTILWENRFPLVSLLLASDDWCLVFPAPARDIRSSRWSVFVAKREFERLSASSGLGSRNCAVRLTAHPAST